MNTPITGGCLCGAVRFECNAEPVLMLKCHCRDCQRLTGGPYVPVVVFPHSAFRVTCGRIQYFATESEKGGQNLRGFCATCGGRLTGAESAERGIIGVVAASLDDPGIFKAKFEMFTADAQPWDALEPQLPHFSQYFAK